MIDQKMIEEVAREGFDTFDAQSPSGQEHMLLRADRFLRAYHKVMRSRRDEVVKRMVRVEKRVFSETGNDTYSMRAVFDTLFPEQQP